MLFLGHTFGEVNVANESFLQLNLGHCRLAENILFFLVTYGGGRKGLLPVINELEGLNLGTFCR